MSIRMSLRMSVALFVALALVAMAVVNLGQRSTSAQPPPAVWNSAMVWQPTLEDAGFALSDLVNQIDASCTVDVDTAVASNGAAPDGPVYAFAITWSCPTGGAGVSTWQSAMLWRPTLEETGNALAELVNQIDASCIVDVDRVVATNGAGPEGPVYAFAITWACPAGVAAPGG
ncbi:hypothetical protein BH20CHL2_BH20CHL2_12920 [soil metagenome]